APESPAAQAFQLYTHYNATGDAFGDRAIKASIDASPDYVATYASLDSRSNEIVVVAINKRDDAEVAATLTLTTGEPASAEAYRFAAGDEAIQPSGSVPVAGSQVQLKLAAASLNLVRLRLAR